MTEDKTFEQITEIKPDKILKTVVEDGKEVANGTTTIENWKIGILMGLGVVDPVIPFIGVMVYAFWKLMETDKFYLEEGVHFKSQKVKVVDNGRDEEGSE